MLGKWKSHEEYCNFAMERLRTISATNTHSLYEYEKEISKLYILNLDKLEKVIAPLYSVTGSPAENQPEIFRSFVLMNSLKIPLDKWMTKLEHNPVLQAAVGVTSEHIPCVSSHYDFINRLIEIDESPRVKVKKRKPTKKYGKNVKMPNRHPNWVQPTKVGGQHDDWK